MSAPYPDPLSRGQGSIAQLTCPSYPQVELQIKQLVGELRAQHQPIRACIARVQALWQELC